MVFVDRQGTDALDGVRWGTLPRQVMRMKTMAHQVSLHAQGIGQTDNAQRLVVRTRDTNLRGRDLTIKTVFAFLALATVAKFSSDGDYPSKIEAA